MNIPPGLKLRHIEAFLAVARSGTISAAARVRNVSQPALSKTVNELETILGTALFERTGRRAILTPAGEGFRAHALAALQSLEAGVRDLSGKVPVGLVKVGVLPTVAGGFFPTVALDYHRTHRDARVGIITGPNRYLLEMLRSGGIDFMVGRMPSAKNMPGLTFEHLYDEPVLLVARADHPALAMPAPKALTTFPLIAPNPGAIIRQIVDQYLVAQGLSGLVPAFETVALPLALSLVEQSDMLWFISRGVVERELRRGTLAAIELRSDYMAGSVGITRRFTFNEDSPADLLARLLHKRAEEMVG
ncbi:HTH-type transcriptional regulator CynR [Labrenzia sp. THAF191b]|uniref:LysR substrate-binding domain-containing protein n=1 Tax=Stappiaceae TaxID=2821832 RepID=UPI0012696BE6|nr:MULTISPECIES: LysR substrate-binding domain-containing protein [Stappiaceae]MCR9283361.1 LysR substrate-binding domain-containing protein [Paracoccaceae bacterium]QFS97221.1 HTH-type transcriptional regulator CynR [Labrenzia sp. THAF191b]QFT03536.1 HTH-type transcriptional regulator CynR [Labrenzia sp. THAF191a]QFT15078.1 HTH-type transcriptional regulator CynR [Labrenzia sp. THAF187b]QFT66541.1 HTH-type transcriptional regulator CynR [Labrenzia sp. THAF35]